MFEVCGVGRRTVSCWMQCVYVKQMLKMTYLKQANVGRTETARGQLEKKKVMSFVDHDAGGDELKRVRGCCVL